MKKHYYEIDFMRACIILGVVCEHLSYFFSLYTIPLSSERVWFDAPVVAFHFTREAFMFITGLVLFITYYHRSFRVWPFWLKRFKLIVIPYIAWNVIYLVFEASFLPGFQWNTLRLLQALKTDLLTGNQFFLYYLVISMQLYLVFPVMLRWLKKIEQYHVWVFWCSLVVQLILMALNKFVVPSLSIAHWPMWLITLVRYRDRFILTYQFWFITGAIVAVHYTKVRSYVFTHARLIFTLLPLATVATIAHFIVDYRILGESEAESVLVLQPIMIPYSLIVAVTFWLIGMKWDSIRSSASMTRVSALIQFFSKASFGIFLVHPLALVGVEYGLGRFLPYISTLERIPLLLFTIAAVYSCSGVVAYFIGRIPWVSYIVGQQTLPRKSGPVSTVAEPS